MLYDIDLDYINGIIDEIALEGLDGITIDGLWLRLSERPNFTIALDDSSKSCMWSQITRLTDVEIYELPLPRNPLVIFNRYDYVDPELGMVLEPAVLPEVIYEHAPIEDTKNGVRGSCPTYHTRRDITHVACHLSLPDALQRWGSRIVLVASQEARNVSLMGRNVNPRLDPSLLQYCVLERVGRSRYLGDVTQGKISLQLTGEDSKALYYHRKYLSKYKLIVKQVHHQKSGAQNCSGSLLHLPRFYVERQPKALFLTEKVIEILKTRQNHTAEYEEIRQKLGLPQSLKKLFKTLDFQRFVKTDMKLPYRTLYPEAKVDEWKHKGSDKEKVIRVIQLINPDMDIRDIWAKEEDIEEEEENTGFLDTRNMLLDRSLLNQVYYGLENKGPEGFSQMELSLDMGLSKLQSRTVCRNLLRKGLVSLFMDDVGRQRVSRFMSKKFENVGPFSVQFMKEKQRMVSLIQSHPKMNSGKRGAESLSIKGETSPKKCKLSQTCHDNENEGSESVDRSDGSVSSSSAFLEGTQVSTPDAHVSYDKLMPDVSSMSSLNDQVIETKIVEVKSNDHGRRDSGSSFKLEFQKIYHHQKKDIPNITYRTLKRSNLIIEAIIQHKVIDDLTKLMKLINEEEEKEGYNVKIDKKSLLRILLQLSKDGCLKIIKVIMKAGKKEKILSFACEPSISIGHTVIQSAIEQAKMKFFIPCREKVTKLPPEIALLAKEGNFNEKNFSSETIHRSMVELKSICSGKTKETSFLYNSKIGKKYGFSPKFLRMQTLHNFLYYLIYGYEGVTGLSKDSVMKAITMRGYEVRHDVLNEMSTPYTEQANWKTFIPPLPVHTGWPTGWAIMCDLLLRLPLSVFVKVFNVSYIIPELEDYLTHPIRRHFLVKHLPSHLRNILMVARKYIFSIHEVMQRLCFIGLIQFGPQRLKEKDQVFIYLNRQTSLLDTTSSRPGYHQISDDITYPERKYEFKSVADVEKYWYEMWNICIHTELGGRVTVTGKDIVLEVLQNKQAMIEATQPRLPSQARLHDQGTVPGDKRGAAGLDSAIFSHLKRNWNWTNTHVSLKVKEDFLPVPGDIPSNGREKDQRTARLDSLKNEPFHFNIFPAKDDGKAKVPRPSVHFLKRKGAITVRKKGTSSATAVSKYQKKSPMRKYIRHVFPRKCARNSSKPYYDDIDKMALRKMSKLRVEWCSKEDNVLLLCKTAATYLCPNSRQQLITFPMIRDVLHKTCPESRNKTSRACQRRILYMLKNKATAHSVVLHLEELHQNPGFNNRFKNSIASLQATTESIEDKEEKVGMIFIKLVKMLQKMFHGFTTRYAVLTETIPDTLEQFKSSYNMTFPSQSLKKRGRFQDLRNIADIQCAVINTIIHSSLCCSNEKKSWTYQLFQIYQQYPDSLLRLSMTKIRSDRMVSLKKSYVRLMQKPENYLPVSSLPYQLSISYINLLQTKYQCEVYHQSYLMMKSLVGWYMTDYDPHQEKGVEITVREGGQAAALVELLCRCQVTFGMEIPDQVIILDPRISGKDKPYVRIFKRYHDILKSYGTKNIHITSSTIFKNSYKGTENPFCNCESKHPLQKKVCMCLLKSKKDEPSTGDQGHHISVNQQNVIARTASRIALYMMKDEFKDSMVGEAQHAHDFFVVNSCRVFCNAGMLNCSVPFGLRDATSLKETHRRVVDPSNGGKYLNELVPVTRIRVKEILQEIQSRIIVSNKATAFGDVRKKLKEMGADKVDWKNTLNILQFIKTKKAIGATIKELRENFSNCCHVIKLGSILSFLEKYDILLKCGVTTTHYVHQSFVKAWLVHSKKTWHCEQDSLLIAKKIVAFYTMQSRRQPSPEDSVRNMRMEEKERCTTRLRLKKRSYPFKVVSRLPVKKCKSASSKHKYACDPVIMDSLKRKVSRLIAEARDQIEKYPEHHSDLHGTFLHNIWIQALTDSLRKNKVKTGIRDSQNIRIAIRPWVRVDGSLNRKVLDHLLGTVLAHCMFQPSNSVKNVEERFTPALQPFHTRELLEFLQLLGCVSMNFISKSCKATLLSRPSRVQLVSADGTEDESRIIVEPQPDAVLRLGYFIGDKLYKGDFFGIEEVV